MAGGTSVPLLRDLQILFDAGTAGGLSDRQLLERFATGRDASSEAAFELLVRRHGPMVLRVCRSSLVDPSDVQDAFQATFLVLVRRSSAVRRFESIGGWLHGVACRLAARARVEAARRRAAEQRWGRLRVVNVVDLGEHDQVDRAEFGPIVQEEVQRLPQKYRGAVVLVYWEGLTHEQAALQLGCPLGTVRSRLARARELLRRRLTRRGVAPLAGAVAAWLGSTTASAAFLRPEPVPPQLIHSTIRAAVRLAAGQAPSQVVSSVAASLVQHVLRSMTMIKVSGVVAGLVVLGLAGYGAGLAAKQPGQSRSDHRVSQDAANPSEREGQLTQPQPERTKRGKQGKRAPKAGPFEGIYSRVQGQTAIMFIVPDGSVVKKGDQLCELDSAALEDQLINQQITARAAEAIFKNFRLAREEAERAARVYRDDLFPREQREIEGEVKVAEAELAVAEEERKSIKPASGDNRLAFRRAELAVARAELALEKSKNRLRILTDHTKRERIRKLTGAVENARSDELAKEAVWELEKSKEQKLERAIAACTIVAPIDGTVVYADPLRSDAATGAQPRLVRVEEGATVRERQLILRIVPAPRLDRETQ
jgi:RNA polymerase sigma factor (sigma-70 family)